MSQKLIRNFSIVAHIDHGKSTLADRLIEFTGGLDCREMKCQVLDSMDIERERGITIKAQTVRLSYRAKDGETYQLNLMDTPGHVDFTYEVSRSLAACEGALLVVDAAQGVQAQTLANAYLAIDNDLEIIPVLNKIDLPSSDVESAKQQITEVIGIDATNAISVSGKTGMGIPDVLEAIVTMLPPPHGDESAPTRALLVDSWYDAYLGVVILVRVVDGELHRGQMIRFMKSGVDYKIDRVGVFTPKMISTDVLKTGEVGFIITGMKTIHDCKIGDTLVDVKSTGIEPLPGFKPSIPVVFSSFFPVEADEYPKLKEAAEKLSLNDASFSYQTENSSALGFGLRCGFLGLLHMEIISERLSREFDLNLITTVPSVRYRLELNNCTDMDLHNPSDMPDPTYIKTIYEPWVRATIIMPDTYVGNILGLCTERRGVQETLTYIGTRVMVVYKLPLAEVVFDFYDRVKSLSQGYASFDYDLIGYEPSDLVKVTILVNGENIDPLSFLCHKSSAEQRGRAIVTKLKDLIPRHQFKIPIQAAIGGRIIARETIAAFSKDVTAKCYGGDATRKRKLLEKQKAGKKRMRSFGNVEIPQSAFINALKIDNK